MKRILKNAAAILVLVFGMAAGCALQTAAAAQNMPAEDAAEQAMPLERTFVLSAAGQSSAAEDDAAQTEYSVNIGLDPSWQYAGFSEINTGHAVLYKATGDSRRNLTVAVNAGHGTKGGASVKTYCHPDKTPKVTGGTTNAGALKAVAVSSGMTFRDGTPEAEVTLRMARILKEKLLKDGYDVLMLRDDTDVQLDNVARTVIANNCADMHIALHWDGDSLDTIKGVFYMSVPDGLKSMEPVRSHWQQHEALGDALIDGLKDYGIKVWGSNPLDMDLTQTSFSTVPSVDIELGNQCSDHSNRILELEADGLVNGIGRFVEIHNKSQAQ
ncbi:MAG: N-acetylmuramoyl-L-alanine amidase [Eubacteriales bacterium]|nr:N-acetylmuramoyl-L-alanine amidase [Eubacteriales bacterium]